MHTATEYELIAKRDKILDSIAAVLTHSNSPSHRRLLIRLRNSQVDDWSSIIDGYVNDDLKKLHQQLEQIETTIYQIEQGMYGYCIECEAKLDEYTLERDPCAQRCSKCQSKTSE